MKVLITKKLMSPDIDYIQSRISPKVELIFPTDYDENSLIKLVKDADVLLGGFFSEELLKNAHALKFIQIPWTGVDNLDFELLQRHKVVICNSHSNAQVVAEHAIAMMMDAAKKISYHDREMRKGNWNKLYPNNKNLISPFSKEIYNSHVALIGFGAISRRIYKLLDGFGCKFTVFNRTGEISSEYIDKVRFFRINDFFDNAKDIDFLFIALPLTSETLGKIDKKYYDAMSNQSILINISRGQVLNQADLFFALSDNIIAGAAIDTWYNYPTPINPIVFPSIDYPFQNLENLILSPHRAGFVNTGFPHLDDAIENINNYVIGLPLKNKISLENKY
jgi:phosphoglycerate dehydrogenase-like enzyme